MCVVYGIGLQFGLPEHCRCGGGVRVVVTMARIVRRTRERRDPIDFTLKVILLLVLIAVTITRIHPPRVAHDRPPSYEVPRWDLPSNISPFALPGPPPL